MNYIRKSPNLLSSIDLTFHILYSYLYVSFMFLHTLVQERYPWYSWCASDRIRKTLNFVSICLPFAYHILIIEFIHSFDMFNTPMFILIAHWWPNDKIVNLIENPISLVFRNIFIYNACSSIMKWQKQWLWSKVSSISNIVMFLFNLIAQQ